MARQQTPTQIRARGFQPVASPTDTFAPTNSGQKLSRIAEALASVAPGLQRYAGAKDATEDRAAVEQGEREALQDARNKFREGQQLGIIKNHQDPITRAVYRESLGRAAANRAMDAWQINKEDNLSEALTLEEYDTEFEDFMTEWEGTHLGDNISEPALYGAFSKARSQQGASDRRNFSSVLAQRLKDRLDDTLYANVSSSLRAGIRDGSGTLESYAVMVQGELDAYEIAGGGTGAERRRGNRSVVRAINDAAVAVAETSDNPLRAREVLRLYEMIETAPGSSLRDNPELAAMIEEGRNRVTQAISYNRNMAAIQNQEAIQEATTEGFEAFVEDPLNASLTPHIERLTALGADATQILQLRNVRNAIASDVAGRDNPEAVQRLTDMIWSTGTAPEEKLPALLAALRSRDLTPNTFRSLAHDLRSALGGQGYGEDVNEIFRNSSFQTRVSNMQSSFGTAFNTATDADHALWRQAEPAMRREWYEWKTANPDAGFNEEQTFLDELDERIEEVYLSESVISGFVPIPKSRWVTDQVTSGDEFGLLFEASQNGALPTGAEDRETLLQALSRLGIQPRLDDPDFTMEEIRLAVKAQEHFHGDTSPAIDIGNDPSGQEPSEEEPTTEEDEPDPEDRLTPIREEFQDLSDEELQNTLADSVLRFRELDDSLGLFRGLAIDNLGKPSASIGFDTEGIQEIQDLRDRIAVLNGIIQRRGIELPDLASNRD